jgi:hypothetical protein
MERLQKLEEIFKITGTGAFSNLSYQLREYRLDQFENVTAYADAFQKTVLELKAFNLKTFISASGEPTGVLLPCASYERP